VFPAHAKDLWSQHKLDIAIDDFTEQTPTPRYNLLICNPPYVRHHHIANDIKGCLQLSTQQACGVRIAGLAGLYCYFLGLSHARLAPGAISGWLIPSEFMDVNYGQAVKRYLLQRVTLLRIHRFDPSDVQFADALVSSAVVWFRNEAPPKDHVVRFTFGGTLLEPNLSRVVSAQALARDPSGRGFRLRTSALLQPLRRSPIFSRSNAASRPATTATFTLSANVTLVAVFQ
jgi:adenine-specific DNA-methyltransferase